MACAAAAVAAAAAVGIDLGTTNSAVAILRKGETYPTIIRDSSGSFSIPSVVSYSPDGSCIVGQQAKQQAAANPLNTFYSVKRLIGRKLEEVKDLELVYGVAAVRDEAGTAAVEAPATGLLDLPSRQCRQHQTAGVRQELAIARPVLAC